MASPALAQKNIFNLRLGMTVTETETMLHLPSGTIQKLPFVVGRRILIDTIAVPGCHFKLRRSIGFDSTNTINVIGFTRKTTPDSVERFSTCMYDWLKKTYGGPSQIDSVDSVHNQYKWKLGDGLLTFETKAYNEHDYFLLLYYYYYLKP